MTDIIQYCTKKQTACKLPSCKHGEEIIGIDFDADDHELTLEEMTPEQEEQFWKGKRFFEPRNPRWEITTNENVHVGSGSLGKIIEECEDYEERERE